MTSWASIAAAAAPPSKESSGVDLFSGKLRIAVVDATALIKGFAFEQICEAAVTVQEVYDEVRDKQARARLHSPSTAVRVIAPSPESVKTVVRCARDTGDLPFLSMADIKLLAVAFEMEKRIHGTAHLCLAPSAVRRTAGPVGEPTALAGWGKVSNPEDWEFLDRLNEQELSRNEENNGEDAPSALASRLLQVGLDKAAAAPGSQTLISQPGADSDADCGHVDAVLDVQKTRADDEGWNPVRKKEKKKQRSPVLATSESDPAQNEHVSSVSCLTGDFGVQNVLLQMGLNLVTPDGVRIRHVSAVGLKCASCFKVTRKTDRVFCHSCGNATLYRVRIEVGEKGVSVIGGRFQPPRRRAAKCTIPPPRGGKKNKDAILSEDVMMAAMQRHRNRKAESLPDITAPGYNEDSWFKTRAMQAEIRDQLPGRFGYPRQMQAPRRRKC